MPGVDAGACVSVDLQFLVPFRISFLQFHVLCSCLGATNGFFVPPGLADEWMRSPRNSGHFLCCCVHGGHIAVPMVVLPVPGVPLLSSEGWLMRSRR